MANQEKNNIEFFLSQYLDGQLTPRQEQDLLGRLETDRDLAEQLRQYRALEEALPSVAAEALAGVDYAAQRSSIMDRLERKSLLQVPQRRVLVLRPRFWGAMAAAAAILLGVSFGWRWLDKGQVQGPVALPDQVVAVKVLPTEPVTLGEAVVKVSLPQLSEADIVPPVHVHAAGHGRSRMVMVSITPPPEPQVDRSSAEPANFMRFEF